MKHWLVVLLLGVVLVGSLAAVVSARDFSPATVPYLGDHDGNRLSDDLDARLSSAGAADKIPVIVALNTAPDDTILARLSGEAGAFTPTALWTKALNGFAAELTKGQLQAVARNPLVTRIDLDREVKACLDTATLWTGVRQARADWGVTGDRDGSLTTFSTSDVVVCVLDTGIDATHVDLDGGKVIGWYDTVNGQLAPYDDNGHGTHCASICAGTGDGNPAYTGVAPGAALVGVKVLDSSGSGSTTGIISGIDWMIANKGTYNIRVGSMSLGASGSSDGTDALSLAVNNAVANGIVMCVAAGNDGPATYTIGTPAAAADAITVGALYDPGEKGWALAEFSSRGPTADGRIKPDICTPGRNITAAKANSVNQYVTMSGTSMATPFCAGLAALMLDANYALTPADVKAVLYNAANVRDFGPAGKDIDFGYGIALPYEDIKQAGGYAGTWTDGLNSAFYTGYLHYAKDSDYYTFSVTDATKPIAVTFIITSWASSRNFDIYLYNPAGTLVAYSTTTKRQEQILYLPAVTGTYKLKVYAKTGSGDYWFNLSWK